MANIVVIGGGPGGLMAAESLCNAGHSVTVYEGKPTLGRKFLMAGRGGLNITHSEDLELFLTRYGSAQSHLESVIRDFTPDDLRRWCDLLGQETFTGTSGRVFPKALKASPLLRAWQDRMEKSGVRFMMRHEWRGWNDDGSLLFIDPENKTHHVTADATILALGGASWPKLGSDGAWVDVLKKDGIAISALRPANCGFVCKWSEIFSARFAGTPVKPVTITHSGATVQSEIMITANGVEGGGIYALSSAIREDIASNGAATITLDLRPGLSMPILVERLQAPRGSQSLSTYLQKSGGLSPVAIGLLRESVGGKDIPDQTPRGLASIIKALPLTLNAPFPIDRAISSAGGVEWNAVDGNFMLRQKPGVFVAGEMLDWEAPTGGYLLQATFATGIAAAKGAENWLSGK